MPTRAAQSPSRRSAKSPAKSPAKTPTAKKSPPKTRSSSRGGTTPAAAKSSKKSPAPAKPKPGTDLVEWQSRAQELLTKRPNYYSDDDTRPQYRGAMYAWVRRTGLAMVVLAAYSANALMSARANWRPALLACRALHVVTLHRNVVLSDELHNFDLILGRAYRHPTTMAREQKLHATDWVAALMIPASYHILFVLGVMQWPTVDPTDLLLLLINLGTFVCMYLRITPARITPAREIFLSYVITFGVQMVLLLSAFYKQRETHGTWLPLWGVYALGLVAKGLEKPNNDVFGHHEILHASVIIGNTIGLAIDALTTA